MESAPTPKRQVREVLDLATDPDISAVQKEEDMRREREEIDRLIQEVDRELAAEERSAAVRLTHSYTDQRRVQRARRRAEHVALRSLPTRLDAVELAELDGEAA